MKPGELDGIKKNVELNNLQICIIEDALRNEYMQQLYRTYPSNAEAPYFKTVKKMIDEFHNKCLRDENGVPL